MRRGCSAGSVRGSDQRTTGRSFRNDFPIGWTSVTRAFSATVFFEKGEGYRREIIAILLFFLLHAHRIGSPCVRKVQSQSLVSDWSIWDRLRLTIRRPDGVRGKRGGMIQLRPYLTHCTATMTILISIFRFSRHSRELWFPRVCALKRLFPSIKCALLSRVNACENQGLIDRYLSLFLPTVYER